MLYTMTSTLPAQHGGRTKSLLSRIAMIEKHLGYATTILTTNYDAAYDRIVQIFREKNILSETTQIDNIYEWLSGNRLYEATTPLVTSREIEGLRAVQVDTDTVRYYDGNTYVLYRKYHEASDQLSFEDFMSPASKKKVERWQYNDNGRLHRKIRYSPKTHKKIHEQFYDQEGHIYCEKHYEEQKRNKLISIQTYQLGRPVHTFQTEKDLFLYYFNHRLTDGDIVFNDARLLDWSLLNCQVRTKNILVFHNSHLELDQQRIKKSYQTALEGSDRVAKYLVLTTHQKDEIQARFPIPDDQFAVIPHSIKPVEIDRTHVEDQFCFIGRFGKQKQLEHLLRSYAIFKRSGHPTKLALYGADEDGQLALMKQMMYLLNIEEDVLIHDFTSTPDQVFAASRASLLTSRFEGFGLTVMESINVGCPVIAYDVRYGPREIIEDGQNGYLVPEGDVTGFAEKMVEIVERPLTHVQTKPTLYQTKGIENYRNLLNWLHTE